MQTPEEQQDLGEPVITIDSAEHFEGHGDKWDTLNLKDAEIMSNVITTSLENGSLLENHVYKDPNGKKNILPLIYPNESDIKVCTLNVTKRKNLSLESMFPLMKGIPNEVTLEKKYTWQNKIEGEVAFKAHGFDSFFFAPFYKQEFKDLKKGSRIKVYFSALAYSIEKAMMKFEVDKGPMYDMQLIEFLEKNPKKTKNDFKNPIVHMDGLVVFFPTKYHSEYEYRGTILELETIEFFGEKIAKTKVCIKRDEDRNDLMYINLYIPFNCFKGFKLKVGMDIQGIIWLQGYCVELP
jgi:hypothetical protein